MEGKDTLISFIHSSEIFIMNLEQEHEVHHQAYTNFRKAAHHFLIAAKHLLEAADAEDQDDSTTASHHAFLAYGHQIQANRFVDEAAIQHQRVDHLDADHKDQDWFVKPVSSRGEKWNDW